VRRTLPVLVVVLVTVLLLAGCDASPKTSASAQRDRLPDVTLASLTDGDAVDLGKLRGPVVVNLWAQWCVPCKRELPIYQAFSEKYAGAVGVLGVDWQDVQPDAARQLATKSGVTYPLVVDSEPEIRAQGLPKLVLVDAHGKIAFQEYAEIKSLAQLEALVEKHLGVTR
jgi:cytochrome c biogenesis protein CcmG/thiol:disulfide interchange protein DsbE